MAMTEAEKRRSKLLKKRGKTGAERVIDMNKRRERKKTLTKIASKIPLLGKAVIKNKKRNASATKKRKSKKY